MAKNRSPRKTGAFVTYSTYSFSGQDPAVKEVLMFVTSVKESSAKSKVATGTIRNWQHKDIRKRTRRPQFATLQAVAIANGKRWRLMDD